MRENTPKICGCTCRGMFTFYPSLLFASIDRRRVYTCRIRYAPMGTAPIASISRAHTTRTRTRTGRPQQHHQLRKPVGFLPSPVIPDLRDKLDAPKHCANRAQHIGCHHVSFRHDEGTGMVVGSRWIERKRQRGGVQKRSHDKR